MNLLANILLYAFGRMRMIQFDWTISVPVLISGAGMLGAAVAVGVRFGRRVCTKLDLALTRASAVEARMMRHAAETERRFTELHEDVRAMQTLLMQNGFKAGEKG